MPPDRLHFEKHVLKNGITLFTHDHEVPFFELRVLIPIGSVHSVPENPGGMHGVAHFLEHILLNRSQKYPEKHSFDRFVMLSGGYINATTKPFVTDFELRARADLAEKAIPGFFSHIFEPLFVEEDIELEAGIVSNERKQKERYYPGTTEFTHYMYTQWKRDQLYSLSQSLGAESDLKTLTTEKLKAFHANYFQKDIVVFIGGTFPREVVIEYLERVPVQEIRLTEALESSSWGNRSYHTHSFRDIEHTIYMYGGITGELSEAEENGISFVGKYVTDSTHGVLYNWLRKEKGWSYSVYFSLWYLGKKGGDWNIEIPLNDDRNVEAVRKELHDRMLSALHNTTEVHVEVDRLLSDQLFRFQTLQERMDTAVDMYLERKVVHSEEKLRELMSRYFKDIDFLMDIYRRYFTPEIAGEFLALPQR